MRIRKSKDGLDAIRIATDLEVAWAAGLYEGEGSCVKGGNGQRSFDVSVSQKDPEVLYRLRDLFGGTVRSYQNNRGTLANKNRPFTIFAWRLCGDRARVFLTAIYPYMTARRRAQIDSTSVKRFIDFCDALPVSDVTPFVHKKLDEWISHFKSIARQNRKTYQQKFYEDRKSDPDFMNKRRDMTRAWRERKKDAQSLSIVQD